MPAEKPPARKYLAAFRKFVSNLRIDSKEISAESADEGVRLDLWESQERVLRCIGEGLDQDIHEFMVLKSRQLGVSTITLAILLFWVAVHSRIFGALVVDNDSNRDVFRDILVRYVESFGAWFGREFQIVKHNKNFMAFSNGSRIDFLVAGKSKANWGESRAYAVALLTEVSKYGNPAGLQSFLEAFSQSNPNRLLMFESTANGPNHYKNMWDDAGTDIHTKRRVFVGWWAKPQNSISTKDPRFKTFGASGPSPQEQEKIDQVKEFYDFEITREQLAWYRWRQSNKATTKEDLDQNQPFTESDAFVLSGFSFFQIRRTQHDYEYARTQQFQGYRYWLGNDYWASKLEQITSQDRFDEIELRMWEAPETSENARYVIGVDPAFGRNDKANNSAICVMRAFADKVVQVAEYADNKHETRQLAWALAHIAGAYRNCMINLEVTGGAGHAVMTELNAVRQQLRAEEYQRAKGVPTGWDDFLSTSRWYLYHRPDSMGAGFVYNWQTQGSTKWRLMNGFRDAHLTEQVVIRSVPCIKEMQVVTQEGYEIGAPGSLNDDRVFAAALAVESWKSWIRPPMMQQGLTYDRLMNRDTGTQATVTRLIDNLTYRTLNRDTSEQRPEDQFLSERGLI